MRIYARCLVLTALLCGGLADGSAAQGTPASAFDLGIYAGGAYTTDWFEIADEGWGPGLAPVFGAAASYWLSPTFGMRLDGKFMPSNFAPEGTSEDNVNTWIYDLNLLFRPSFVSTLPGAPYSFAGVTLVNASPENGSGESGFGANAGIGSDFSPIGSGLVPFGEAGLHVYQAPLDVGERRFVFSAGLKAGVRFRF